MGFLQPFSSSQAVGPNGLHVDTHGTNTQAKPAERTLFAEYHGEGVHAPCFMARRGPYKYIYVHGHEERLFDLEADPEEYEDLLAGGEGSAVARSLREELLTRFDPDVIARAALQSQANRRYIFDRAKQAAP
jgi:hypothetical protein